MELKEKINNLKYVGEKRIKQYSALKINNIKDLLTHFPVKYLVYKKKLISQIEDLEKAAVCWLKKKWLKQLKELKFTKF